VTSALQDLDAIPIEQINKSISLVDTAAPTVAVFKSFGLADSLLSVSRNIF
jgi:hypothetical protein